LVLGCDAGQRMVVLLSKRNPSPALQLFVQPLRKVTEEALISWSNVPFSAASLNVFKPAVTALMEEEKWPFRPHNYAINNGVMRSGNFARLARQGVPAVLCSLMIHATSECIAISNAKSDTNAKAYGNELLNTMEEILGIGLILASGCTRRWGDVVDPSTVAFFRETCPVDIVLHPADMEAVQHGRTHPAHINCENTIAPILALIGSPSKMSDISSSPSSSDSSGSRITSPILMQPLHAEPIAVVSSPSDSSTLSGSGSPVSAALGKRPFDAVPARPFSSPGASSSGQPHFECAACLQPIGADFTYCCFDCSHEVPSLCDECGNCHKKMRILSHHRLFSVIGE